MKKYRVFLKQTRMIDIARPIKLKYDILALSETKAALKAFQLVKEKYGELDYYSEYCIENIIEITG
jgi:hypothetical protein